MADYWFKAIVVGLICFLGFGLCSILAALWVDEED